MVPRTYHIFGSSIRADIELDPQSSDLILLAVDTEVQETRILRTSYENGEARFLNKLEYTVARNHMDVPEEEASRHLNLDLEQEESPGEYPLKFRVSLDLPRSLTECRQSTLTGWIKISHAVRFQLRFRRSQAGCNQTVRSWPRIHLLTCVVVPDQMPFQLTLSLPITLFISPKIPLGDDQAVQLCETEASAASIQRSTTLPRITSTIHRTQVRPSIRGRR